MVGHKKQWEFLKNKFESENLSHAYLFSGPEETDIHSFTKEFIKLVNSKNITGSDVAIEKEQFPDLLVARSINSKSSVDNQKDMMEIDVAQIREVNKFLSYKSYYGGYKAVIIEHAERMNLGAQSCFLKTLEEPRGKTIIFLISSKPETLLATIFSRCQNIKFFPQHMYKASPAEQKTLKELLPMLNAELAAKFQYTKKVNLEGNNFNKIMEALQRYFRDLLLARIGVEKSVLENNYSVVKLKKIIRLIESLNNQISMTNANPKLALEILLLEL